MLLAAYIRVSRVAGREGPSFISPTEQRRQIEAWAEPNHSLEWFEDLDQPGSRAERPGLNAAMELVESGGAKGIVVAKLDRFGRSVVHQGALLERLRSAGGALFTVTEGIDTRGTTGKLVADILAAIAEWELTRIRENWASARSAAASRGAYLAEAPVGYRKTEEGGLEPTETAAKVAEVFSRRAAGDSWATIARWLDSEGIPSRRGGKWTVRAVRNIVANRAYLGESEGLVVHEAVVDRATFEAAQAVKGVAPQRSGRASGLLSGVLRCAGCRYAMKLSQGRTRHGKAFTEYRCKAARKENAGACSAPAAIKANVVEPFVMRAFWLAVHDLRGKGRDSGEEVAEAEARVRQAEVELDAALDRRLVDALGGDDAPAYLEAIRRRQDAVDEARADLREVAKDAHALPDVNLRDLWPDLSLYDQRKLLAAVFDCVFVRRGTSDRIFICLRGEAPELPTRGRRWVPRPFHFPSPAEPGT